tara:strand:- start:222 stop:440 length:219 start_codon:yes stop_codon:yes gene_type:complete
MAMLGTEGNPVKYGLADTTGSLGRIGRLKLPHGWLLTVYKTDGGLTFVPFAENGTGWGKNEPVELWDVPSRR